MFKLILAIGLAAVAASQLVLPDLTPHEHIIVFKKNANPATVKQLILQSGGQITHVFNLINGIGANIPVILATAISRDPSVAYVERVQKVEIQDHERSYIVVFKPRVTEADKTNLRQQVAQLGGKVTQEIQLISGIVVVLTPVAAQRLRKDPRVAYIEENGIVTEQNTTPEEFIIVFKKGANSESVKSQIVKAGGVVKHVFTLINGISVKIPASLAEALTHDSNVEYVEKVGKVEIQEGNRDYIIAFKPDVAEADKTALRQQMVSTGAKITAELKLINGIAVTLPVAVAEKLSQDPRIAYVEKNGKVTSQEKHEYIVVLKVTTTEAAKKVIMESIISNHGTIETQFKIVKGFTASLSDNVVEALKHNKGVAYVEPVTDVHTQETKHNYVIMFKSATVSQARVRMLIQKNGGKINHEYKMIAGLAATIPDSLADQIRSEPSVKVVELDKIEHTEP